MNNCSLPEFVGTTVLDTIGLVIPGIDSTLREEMKLPKHVSALGILSSRTGAAGQICAIDEAIKNTSTEIISIDLPRDTKGWGGHGNYIVIGGHDVSDCRRAIEIALELKCRKRKERKEIIRAFVEVPEVLPRFIELARISELEPELALTSPVA